MEVDAPKAPFPLKRLLRESLSQLAWGLVLWSCLGVGNALLQGIQHGFSIYTDRFVQLLALGNIALPLLLAAPVLILDRRKQRREKSVAGR